MKTDGSRRRLTRGRHLAALSVLVLACSISPTAATCSGEAIFEAPDGAISVVPDDAVRWLYSIVSAVEKMEVVVVIALVRRWCRRDLNTFTRILSRCHSA